jgi:hypothetical protein
MNIKDLFTRKKKTPERKQLMQHFSQEYLQSLVNEHKLIQASINRLTQRRAFYVRENSVSVMDKALDNFRVRKMELEVQIDELNEFLHG